MRNKKDNQRPSYQERLDYQYRLQKSRSYWINSPRVEERICDICKIKRYEVFTDKLPNGTVICGFCSSLYAKYKIKKW